MSLVNILFYHEPIQWSPALAFVMGEQNAPNSLDQHSSVSVSYVPGGYPR